VTPAQHRRKRAFDLAASGLGLLAVGVPLLVLAGLARWSTGASGFFVQQRIGRAGQPIPVVKLRTMRPSLDRSTVTTAGDPRITRFGAFLRRTKLDELPQLWSVLRGHMSFVGPRPDVPGYADRLQGDDRRILELRPGITGPATLAFRDEEELLAAQPDPQRYNDEVLWPEKVRLNRDYLDHWTLRRDLAYIWQTVVGKN
jgi:lipopolysaccharide/colanic/teichoic acid biosynthesis glycosyltransferase